MATITDLQTRIILDTNRDDLNIGGELAQALTDAISDAIENYADELFWFNRMAATLTTTASTATSAYPAGMRRPNVVTYLGMEMPKVPLEAIEANSNMTAPVRGVPVKWSDDGNALHFHPTPDGAYLLGVYGIADLGVPSISNAWTNEGYRLILGEAKKILYRGSLRDPDGLALANDEVEEALSKLRRETQRRGASSLRTDIPVPHRFNIITG